ncbi:hypothetical protein [Edaphobacillus lindanitolerans]|uniref:Uncharacterized protein n=1 Tax=Edaphobacillus lindanitolerans TaxID=550447 RepID=A0A1U7PSK5_9BACI|nr:hypothetical protein [Edaphobacillus lindanitolerans]SIT91189.1 hypothetical protein SAMN05428946_2619 [Edaphobacillus lindanitolerans]
MKQKRRKNGPGTGFRLTDALLEILSWFPQLFLWPLRLVWMALQFGARSIGRLFDSF